MTCLMVACRNLSKAPKYTLLIELPCIRLSNIKFMVTDGSGQRRARVRNEGGQGCLSEGRRAKEFVSNIKFVEGQK
jgi:HSP20 family molecular chaperone IbpA